MTEINFHDPFNSLELVGLNKHFNDLTNLYDNSLFPNVLLISGKKGIGKFTLVNHFLNYIFTKNEKFSYDFANKKINKDSLFYQSILNKSCQNVLFIKAELNKNIKIEQIRNLKQILSKSSLNNGKRFIIIDEVEFLNENSINALLKTLEEPGNNNYFILIDSQQKTLIETISSRCIKNKVYLSTDDRKKIIKFLLEKNDINNDATLDELNLSPGLFLEFNIICNDLKIVKDTNILDIANKLLNLYQKTKNRSSINLLVYFIEYFFYSRMKNESEKINSFIDVKSNIIKNINDLVQYNLNINTVINSIEKNINSV